MKNGMKLYVVMFSCGLFLAGGCANKEVVKKDEGMASAPVAKPAESPKNGAVVLAPQKEQAALPVHPSTSVQEVPKNTSASQLQSALDKIYFDFDSSKLSDAARATLAKNASVLMKATAAKIRVEGNCDEHGSAEYNLALGERRAQTAKKYLETLGISEGRLSTVSYGKERPVDQGHDETAWKKNRRDEFVVVTP
ncbi:peptidoglycan-associated lipoprotein Pal [Geobacter sp. AOG2]|uniref:peptidoglycan-associated lipoprotein Pal n=1 Tax=Geobacter sp. AOG2 TaxID=1566347 RepID=UPI001CC73FC1|nr:peptidoglycan-associated lipoprotein Pal [Geobacter sp. AOG2]GFE60748.1 peptidoglycan-associated lipoprotein [Geobacter sp. AOG2]